MFYFILGINQLDVVEAVSIIPFAVLLKQSTNCDTDSQNYQTTNIQSLTTPQIVYDLMDYIRPNHEEDGPLMNHHHGLEALIDLQLTQLGIPKDLHWLLEFAEHKAESFPHLRRIELFEPCGRVQLRIHPKNWDLPPDIAEAFVKAGIEFRGVMRIRPKSDDY